MQALDSVTNRNEQKDLQDIPAAFQNLSTAIESAAAATTPAQHSPSRVQWAIPLALLPILTGFSFSTENKAAGAEKIPHTQAVVTFSENAWGAVKPAVQDQEKVSARHWNDLQAVMLAADNAGIHEVQTIREQIVLKGISNPEIPARIVHAALYSSVEYVKQMRIKNEQIKKEINILKSFKEELLTIEGDTIPESLTIPKALQIENGANPAALLTSVSEKLLSLESQSQTYDERIADTGTRISKAAIPYLGKVIVDSENSEGIATRVLIHPSDAKKFQGKEGMYVYAPDRFEHIAAFVIGNTGTAAEFSLVHQELQRTDLRSERADLLFAVFLYARDRTEANVLLPHVQEFVFRGPEKIADITQFKLVEGIPTLITTPPNDKMEKILAPLGKIDKNLIQAMIADPFGSDKTEQDAFAKAMLYLAQQQDPRATSAIGQWFTLRTTKSTVSSIADDYMHEALGVIALQNDTAFQLLLTVAAGDPKLMETILEAPLSTQESPRERAGRNFLTALRAHPEEAHTWIRSVADGTAATLLQPATNRSSRDTQQSIKNATREQALKMMAYLDTHGTFSDYLRAIVENPFAGSRSSSDMKIAISGLAMQHDQASIPLLLKKAVDPSLTNELKQLSLSAALYIDTPDIIPQETKDSIKVPFNHANVLRFTPIFNHKTGERFLPAELPLRLQQLVDSNPFQSRIMDRYAGWVERTQAQIKDAQNNGHFPTEISNEEKLQAYLRFKAEESGRSGSLLQVLATDPELKEAVVRPLIDYLRLHRDPRRHINTSQAQTILEILARAGITEAQDLIIDIVRNPKHFASEDMSTSGGFMLQMQTAQLMELKATAITALGGTVKLDDPDDRAAAILHTIARKESSSVFRDAALNGLNRLADRYDSALQVESIDRDRILAAQKLHGEQVTKHLLHHAQGLDTTGQIRLRALDRNFAFARVADRLNGTSALLLAANTAANKNPAVFTVNSEAETNISLRPDIVRSIMHALISNGKTVDSIKDAGLDAAETTLASSLFQFVDNEVYWLGEPGERQYTGTGTDIVVLDAGYVYPVPMVKGLGERVLYPEGLEGYDPVQRLNFESAHPTAVAATAFEKAPKATIHSYNAWEGLQDVAFRPEDAQGEVVRALEHIVERKIRGEVDFDAINYSFSYRNYALQNEAFREELLDLTGAYMELASTIGIKHSVSAGNSRGDSPASARYGGLGEINALGLRFNDEKQYEQPDGVFIAGAQDAFAGARLTEFTSSGDPLVPDNNLRVISYDGANVLLPWVDGKWVLMPINGTSFSAPNQQAMIAWAEEAFDKAGVTPGMAEWRTLLNNSRIVMKQYDDYEGGSFFHVATFMREINKIIAAHQ